MSISYQTGNYARDYNSLYNITLDVSGWQRTTVQLIPPMVGSVLIYGTNDGGALLGVREGSPKNATNFNPIQMKNLSTGSSVNATSSAGDYEIDINTQYIRLQGSPTGAGSSIYGIIFNHTK
ncbi:MAG TPA: hypothetical protein VIH61_10650 [Waddliaceae bacterium]